jgi:hypothetical protein
MAASGKGLHFQEDFRHPVAHILMINQPWMTGSGRNGLEDFTDELFVGFIHADQGKSRVVRKVIEIEHIFHADNKGGV